MTLLNYFLAMCINYNCVVILSDFNIHIDNSKDDSAKEQFNILNNFGLSQHVADSHNKGHILDLIIPKGVHITEVSDRYCVFFKIEYNQKHYANDNIFALCMQAFPCLLRFRLFFSCLLRFRVHIL